MDLSKLDQVILARFQERTQRSGGVQPGYGMRFTALSYLLPSSADLKKALDSLVERGVLKVNEAGTWYYLTESGAEWVKAA